MLLDKYRDKVSLSIGDKIKYCNCPESEVGKIKVDPFLHLSGCPIRKKAARYTTTMSVVQSESKDGYRLGVAL